MKAHRTLWLGVMGAMVALGTGCGGVSNTPVSRADESVGLAEDAIRQAEDKAQGTDLFVCVSQCTQKLRADLGAGRTLAQTQKLIDEIIACAEEC